MKEKEGTEKMNQMEEFQCLMTLPNLGDYVDKWIALVGDEIIATGETGVEVYKIARERHPDSVPMILKVPSDRIMLL